MNSDAKRLCCFVTSLEAVGSDDARLFAVGLDLNVVRCRIDGLLQVCDWNMTLNFDVLVLRL
jgi:hypothetical protein